MTKKDLLERMNGKQVKVNYENMMTVDDNEKLKQSIIESLEKNGKTIDDFEETDDNYSVKGFANFWRKSKLIQNEQGIFTVRSKDYIFDNGSKRYGEIPKGNEFEILSNGNGFKKNMGNKQYIIYEIV